MKHSLIVLICTVIGLAPAAWGDKAPASESVNRVLLIVVDGLRPDYITPELMPNLHALGERGVFGDVHSAAYPTNTRVNSASISTGSYPARHGLLHNHMFVPEVSDEPFSTGSAAALRRLDEATGGRMLTAVSMAEVLDQNARRVLATGSGGSGTTLLLNPRVAGAGIWTARGVILPQENRDRAIEAVGDSPQERPDATAWGVNAYLHHALSDDPPHVTLMWINEPDAAGHANGVGAPATLEAIANVDRHIGRIVQAHEENGLSDRVNIFVTTDHGFSTSTGGFRPARVLDEHGLLDEVRMVRNMIYPHREDPDLLARIVEALQRDPNTGNIYTHPAQPGASEGIVPGTLSTDLIQWNHPRSSPIIVSPAWTDEVNEHGFAGTTASGGTASHGSDSPFDVQIRLVAAGPDIKRGLRSNVPTANVDFAPTILHLQGIEPPAEMDGRILHELLRGGPDLQDVDVQEQTYSAEVAYADGFRYQAALETKRVGSTLYLRGARTQRSND